jgi:hypothetical protein
MANFFSFKLPFLPLSRDMLRIIILAIAFGITTSVTAQEIRYGLRIGFSIATFGGDDIGGSETNFRNGFSLGAFSSIPISSKVRFEPGLDFNSKGAKTEYLNLINTIYRNGYLDVPLLFNFQMTEKFSVIGGPQPSLLLTSTRVLGEGDNKVVIKGSDAKGLWKDTDFAGVIGLGYTNSNKFQIELVYEHGFVIVGQIPNSVYNRVLKTTYKAYF